MGLRTPRASRCMEGSSGPRELSSSFYLHLRKVRGNLYVSGGDEAGDERRRRNMNPTGTIRTKMISNVIESAERVDFDTIDNKGRKIGAMIRRETQVYEEMSEAEFNKTKMASLVRPGTWYTFYVSTTRNGATFGASQPTHYFRSIEERDVAIHAHIARSMKAAAKKAAA